MQDELAAKTRTDRLLVRSPHHREDVRDGFGRNLIVEVETTADIGALLPLVIEIVREQGLVTLAVENEADVMTGFPEPGLNAVAARAVPDHAVRAVLSERHERVAAERAGELGAIFAYTALDSSVRTVRVFKRCREVEA